MYFELNKVKHPITTCSPEITACSACKTEEERVGVRL